MTAEERKLFKQKIEAQIKQLDFELIQLEALTQPISPENSIGRISRMDAINNKSVAEAALRNSKKKLGKLKLALTKVDLPEFGKCKLCKNPIPMGRLMFMPESTRCVRCADR
ncbi:MAG TPA: TraR/DksA family transcriptional regulator [Saprospiraceae bacterium]|nr:TraR/DksA family transcriptional regulator [Saprospiraceae bacterium]